MSAKLAPSSWRSCWSGWWRSASVGRRPAPSGAALATQNAAAAPRRRRDPSADARADCCNRGRKQRRTAMPTGSRLQAGKASYLTTLDQLGVDRLSAVLRSRSRQTEHDGTLQFNQLWADQRCQTTKLINQLAGAARLRCQIRVRRHGTEGARASTSRRIRGCSTCRRHFAADITSTVYASNDLLFGLLSIEITLGPRPGIDGDDGIFGWPTVALLPTKPTSYPVGDVPDIHRPDGGNQCRWYQPTPGSDEADCLSSAVLRRYSLIGIGPSGRYSTTRRPPRSPVERKRQLGGRVECLAGLQVEARQVERAGQRVVGQEALVELEVLVRADALGGVPAVLAVVDEQDVRGVHLDHLHRPGRDVFGARDVHAARRGVRQAAASEESSTDAGHFCVEQARSRSWASGSGMRDTTGSRKPSTMNLRACSRGMPRLIR